MEWENSEAAEKNKRACAGGPEGSGSLGHFKGAQAVLWWFVVSHCKALPPRPWKFSQFPLTGINWWVSSKHCSGKDPTVHITPGA